VNVHIISWGVEFENPLQNKAPCFAFGSKFLGQALYLGGTFFWQEPKGIQHSFPRLAPKFHENPPNFQRNCIHSLDLDKWCSWIECGSVGVGLYIFAKIQGTYGGLYQHPPN